MSGRAVICWPFTKTAPSAFWRSEMASSSSGLLRKGKPVVCAQAPAMHSEHKAATQAFALGALEVTVFSGREGESKGVAKMRNSLQENGPQSTQKWPAGFVKWDYP